MDTRPQSDNGTSRDDTALSLSSLLSALASRLEELSSNTGNSETTQTPANCAEENGKAKDSAFSDAYNSLQTLISALRTRTAAIVSPSPRDDQANLRNLRQSINQLGDIKPEADDPKSAEGLSLPSIFSALSAKLSGSAEPENPGASSSAAIQKNPSSSADSSSQLADGLKNSPALHINSDANWLSASALLAVLAERLGGTGTEKSEQVAPKEAIRELPRDGSKTETDPTSMPSEDVSGMTLALLLKSISDGMVALTATAKGEELPLVREDCDSQKYVEPSDVTSTSKLSSSSIPSLSSVLAALSDGFGGIDLGREAMSSKQEEQPVGNNIVNDIETRDPGQQSAELAKAEPTSPILQSLLTTMGARIEELSTANVQAVLRSLQDAKVDLSQQVMLATMRALGVEPLDSEDSLEDVHFLRSPFDPILTLVLAGYSFRAYENPPRNSYRETFTSIVPGSENSGLPDQLVHVEFVYPDTSIISRRANGLFMLHVFTTDEQDGRFINAEVNGAVVLDILKKGHCSLLRQTDPWSSRLKQLLHREEDCLTLSLYENATEYDAGKNPTHAVSMSLAEIVGKGLDLGTIVDGDVMHLVLNKVSEEDKDMDFFQFSLLPREMKLPFQYKQEIETSARSSGSFASLSISLRATFVPFGKSDTNRRTRSWAKKTDAGSMNTTSIKQVSKSSIDPQLQSVLDKELPRGNMPDPADWTKLAGVVRSLLQRVGPELNIARAHTVSENVPRSLFIESLATDTEVWFFHDEASKDIIISFRGTEQVSWKDFFTDAQIFLQKWEPGEEINLNVDLSRTVGLADMVPSIFPNAESSIPAESSAVHYGFLRAYMSIRDAMLRGIDMLSSNLSEGYSLHFTGHSLGGALAIIASSDFQARHLFDNFDVSCISYGAPKVGNLYFARLYNQLVPNSFRIVNDADLVSRMPRSLSSSSPLGRYRHAGRTVLVNNDGEYWIEGQKTGVRPGTVMATLADPFVERYQNLQDLVTFEQQLWSQLVSGRSVQHHMVRLPFCPVHCGEHAVSFTFDF